MKRTTRTVVAVSTLALFAASGAVLAAAKAASSQGVVFGVDDAKFFPLDPSQPDGLKLAVVSGDPQKGESVFYLKLHPGTTPDHFHSSDYRAVLVQGEAKHWPQGAEAQAKTLKPGSFWFQPGKEPHGDACVGKDDCVILIHMNGKFDFVPAPAAAASAKK